MSQTYETSVAERELPAIPQADMEEDVAAEGDEVFVLRPLARERMTARVVKTQVSPFRYVDDYAILK